MKKQSKANVITYVLVLMLVVSLCAGCGEKNVPTSNSTIELGEAQGEEQTEVTEEPIQETTDLDRDITEVAAELNQDDMTEKGFMLPETTMLTGESMNINYQFRTDVGKVTWKSVDPSIVKVGKNGKKIKAKSEGVTDLVGFDEAGSAEYKCRVTVETKPESVIYLTFDDGPTRYSTPKVLKILDDNGVKATFFEIKPAKEDYDLTQRVIDEGHTLAIHGYSHDYAKIYASDGAYHKNLTKLQDLFYKNFGKWCTITRFPGGSSNTISRHYSSGIMSRLSKKVPKWGFTYYDWNVSSGDAGGANNADQVYKFVTSGIQKGRGNVVLMHDFAGNDKTINALDRIIKWGKDNGFEFRSLTPSSVEVHHGVNN
ncbi:MAG: polysaccharide deacetylase [Eubacterium sp.]|nr:polysaccharide deacetylase [Eubacterium sp.]